MADHSFREGVATAIRTLRGEHRWTQRELCRRADLSPAYLSELESGQKDASVDIMERIAIAFNYDMDEFLWVVLLAMLTGEVPGVTRRDGALKLLRHVIESDPQSRKQIEEFVEFQQWKRANRATPAPRTRPEKSPGTGQDEHVETDFTED